MSKNVCRRACQGMLCASDNNYPPYFTSIALLYLISWNQKKIGDIKIESHKSLEKRLGFYLKSISKLLK